MDSELAALLSGASGPFVLIDDARPGGAGATLYHAPADCVCAGDLAGVVPALEALRRARADGLHAAGFLAYEAGYALEPRLAGLDPRRAPGDPPLLWFGLFGGRRPVVLPPAAAGDTGVGATAHPALTRAGYGVAFDAVRRAIVAGDIYQANLTFACAVALGADPLTFYRAVRPRAAAGHGALLFTGTHWLLSFSPEMFFTLEQGVLTTRPMKGTARRGRTPAQDAARARALAADPKQRAENLMIVDLLRNDLSRIAVPGSVRVPDLFAVEAYPTVLQMVSTVTARLAPGRDAVDALRALFPCGSITGAPKIRAMEIVHALEGRARGPYTGAIGTLDANGDAAFNVAIRTLCVREGEGQGQIGLGSGLVIDSIATNEWDECLDKGRFLAAGATAGSAADDDGRGDERP